MGMVVSNFAKKKSGMGGGGLSSLTPPLHHRSDRRLCCSDWSFLYDVKAFLMHIVIACYGANVYFL